MGGGQLYGLNPGNGAQPWFIFGKQGAGFWGRHFTGGGGGAHMEPEQPPPGGIGGIPIRPG